MSDLQDIREEIKQIIEHTTPDELIEWIQAHFAALQNQTTPLPDHDHSFVFLLNQNHTALRGCACGLTFAGLMAGPSPEV